jgi:hypothetical protein
LQHSLPPTVQSYKQIVCMKLHLCSIRYLRLGIRWGCIRYYCGNS